MRNKLTFLLTFFLSYSAFAVPLFYKCEKGQLSTVFHSEDYEGWLKKFTESSGKDQTAIIEILCKGKEECMARLGQVALLAKIGQDTATKIFQEELAKLPLSTEPTKLSASQESAVLGLNAIKETLACQETQKKLGPENFLNEDKAKIFYPYYSNYMYVTGCSKLQTEKCEPAMKSNIESVINDSIAMGVDPYVVLSLNLMEDGPSGLGGLYLDPIGMIDTMGCPGKQVANGTPGSFHSFGTSFKIEPKVIENGDLGERIAKALVGHKSDLEKGTNYYCMDLNINQKQSLLPSPKDNACCLKIPLKLGSDQSLQHVIDDTLTMEYVRKMMKSSFRGKTAPEWRLQRFNGYTDLMGAAEGVSPWRAGVNYYETPAYGYQAMDFYLNSFLLNPLIADMIDKQKQKGNEVPSLLCQDQVDGAYFYDTKFFFQMHKDADRLKVQAEKQKNGISLENLSTREKNVVMAELYETSKDNPHIPKYLTSAQLKNFEEKGLWVLQELFEKSELISFEEFQMAVRNSKISLTDAQIKAVYQYQELNDETRQFTDEAAEKEIEMMNDLYQKIGFSHSNLISQAFHLNDQQALKTLEQELEKEHYDFLKSIIELKKINDSKETESREKMLLILEQNSLTSFKWDARLILTMVKKKPSLDVVMKVCEDSDDCKLNKSEVASYHQHMEEGGKPFNKEEAYQHYFQNIYPKRATISTASSFPWREFTDEEIRRLGDNLMKENQ